MRKTRRSKDSKVVLQQKRQGLSKKAIWGIILAGIMVLSGVGFYFGSDTETTYRYNGFKFTQDINTGNLLLHYQDKEIPFFDSPQNALQLETDADAIVKLKSVPQFYVTFDPNQEQLQTLDLVRFDIATTLAKDFSIMVGSGVLTNQTNQTAYASYPILTCSNATQYVPVLVLQYGNSTGLTRNDTNCFIASAEQQTDLVRLRDRILYSFYGVLP